MNISQFFEHWRIVENPFRGEEARHDAVFARVGFKGAGAAEGPEGGPVRVGASLPEEPAGQTRTPADHATHHSDFEKILGDLAKPSTAIVFGEKGSGKTAIRLQIAERVAAHNAGNGDRRILLVAYDDLNAALDRYHRRIGGKTPLDAFQKFRLVDHIDAILAQIVPRLMDGIVSAGPRWPGPQAPAASPAERLELGPDPRRIVRRLSAPERRDLLLLQAVYDRPEVAPARTARLRRTLRLRPLWGPLLWTVLAWIGWVPAAALAYWMFAKVEGGFQLDSNLGYGLLALVGLWATMLFKRFVWDKLGLMRLARRVRRQVRVQNRPDTSYARSIRHLDATLRDSSHLPLTESDEARYGMLGRLRTLLRRFGYSGLLVVIDRVDEPTLISGEPDRMKAVVWPLLNNKFLQQEGIGVKMLLPIELRHALFKESSAFFQEARLDKQNLVERLAWTGAMLYELCDARLKACLSPGAPPVALLDLFAEDVTGRDLVDSLDQMHQPRDAFKFLYACISEHCSNVTAEQQQWRIPRLILELVRKQQSERVQQLYRGIRPA
ncbi:MAG: hypothetical protein WD749_09935 [Phycisphaerales bacterium]